MPLLTASIVTYKTEREMLDRVMGSVLATPAVERLFISDNSPQPYPQGAFTDPRVEYVFNNANLGYGSGHNVAIRKAMAAGARYHAVINPDIFFEPGALEALLAFMEDNPRVGQAMPKVLYPDGSLQYLCKMLPTPLDLFVRRFWPDRQAVARHDARFELHASGYDRVMDIPYLSGSFMFLRLAALEDSGLFDENIFLHLEDLDLTRRIGQAGWRTVFFPGARVYHEFQKGSHTSFKIMLITIRSAIYYFNKHGWLFDKQRREVNRRLFDTYCAPQPDQEARK